MAAVAFVTPLAVPEYLWIALRVARARGQYGIRAPATSERPALAAAVPRC